MFVGIGLRAWRTALRSVVPAALFSASAILLATAGPARAADTEAGSSPQVGSGPEPLILHQPYSAAATTARTPLMSLFDNMGVGQTLDDMRIRIYGHIEGSITHNFDNPPTIARTDNFGRIFDAEDNHPTLNQLTLNFERVIDPRAKQFDVGGRIELMYGGDARFIHSNGLFDSPNFFHGPDNNFDVTQAYVDVAIPVGDGLRIRAGKFEYFKQIDPNASVFYSHSFTFGGALPFTLTGIYGTYLWGDQFTFDAGISRGWDQSLKDNNGAVDFFGRVKYVFNPQTSINAAFIVGPEQDKDNSHYRPTIDITLSHAINKDLTLLVDGVYGYESHPDTATTFGKNEAMWYGVSGYLIQRLTDQFSAAARLEWYRDDGGYTTGETQTLYEATAGLTITPFPNDRIGQNLKIRPEVRLDYSNQKYFDGFSKYQQVTVAVDAFFNF